MTKIYVYDTYGQGLALVAGNAASYGFYAANFYDTDPLGDDFYLDMYAAGRGFSFTLLTNSLGTSKVYDDIVYAADFERYGNLLVTVEDANISFGRFLSGGLQAALGGNDQILGNKYGDTLHGFSGKDLIFGGGGDDFVFGDSGNDNLSGNFGRDRINGGGGNDAIFGNQGNDVLTGSSGQDAFFFENTGGSDTISDFNHASDSIVIDSGAVRFSQIRISDIGQDALVTFGNVRIVFANFDHRDLERNDFVFI